MTAKFFDSVFPPLFLKLQGGFIRTKIRVGAMGLLFVQ